MISDTEIRYEGMKCLREKLGLVEAEKFISLIRKEPFNYTEWQSKLWQDESVEQIYNKAKDYHEKNNK